MKGVLRISLLLVVGFAIGRFSHEGAANAQVADRAPPCQDANGDGQSNVADAVFLLTWLFGGGTAPECTTAREPTGLPDTGQTNCFDQVGNVIDCTSDTCAGQDGLYTRDCLSEGRFIDNRDGTVMDTCTGLMWQKDTGNDERWLSWCGALSYCEDLELGGHDDWRLPNVRELQSIVDYGRFDPAIDPVFDVLSSFYWSSTYNSSTSDAEGSGDAWYVGFGDGRVDYAGVEISGGRGRVVPLVLAVRTTR